MTALLMLPRPVFTYLSSTAVTPNWHASSSSAMSFLLCVMGWMARNNFGRGVRDLCRIVPALTVVWKRQAER